MKDINVNSCRWHMRIWDLEKNEWLCEHNGDMLPYYGFDIRGGEVAAIQGMDVVYKNFLHKDFIWEQSTGLKDKNGKEIYEGDIMEFGIAGAESRGVVGYEEDYGSYEIYTNKGYIIASLFTSRGKIIGNVHENPELLNA